MQPRGGLSRRGILQSIAGAAVATTLLPGKARADRGWGREWEDEDRELPTRLRPVPQIKGAPGTEKYWRNVRRAFTLPENYIHMNTGTTGSQPVFSLSNLIVYNLFKSLDPRDWEANLAAAFPDLYTFPAGGSRIGALQAEIAAMYGANANEVVLSYNTSHGLQIVFNGINWNAGDRIVTTQMEHAAGIGPMAAVRDGYGVNLAIVDIPSHFDMSVNEFVDLFRVELAKPLPAGAKQYVLISEIPFKNGLRLPVKEIVAAAKALGAWSIVDTAHGWGMLPIHCHDYGADFIAGAGHKWLCGGPGTGILYIRNQGPNLPQFNYGQEGWGSLFVIPNPRQNNRAAWTPAAALQTTGEYNRPAVFAMADSARFFNSIGLQRIYERGVSLASYLQSKVAGRWGSGVLSVSPSADPRFKTFLTAFNPFKAYNDPSQFSTMLTALNQARDALGAGSPKIYIRSITWRDKTKDPGTADNRAALRISTHALYNDPGEIDEMFRQVVKAIDATGLPQA
jgi:selenocysteine lyase/cysteine desulfurase